MNERRIDPAGLGDNVLDGVFAYWQRIRAGRPYPARKDVDPAEIGGALLPHILLSDIAGGGRSVRHRVVGTAFSDYFTHTITNVELSSFLKGDYLEFILSLYQTMVERQSPVFCVSRFRWDVGRFLVARRLILPLSRDGTAIDMALTAQTFDRHAPIPAQPVVRVLGPNGAEDVSLDFMKFGTVA